MSIWSELQKRADELAERADRARDAFDADPSDVLEAEVEARQAQRDADETDDTDAPANAIANDNDTIEIGGEELENTRDLLKAMMAALPAQKLLILKIRSLLGKREVPIEEVMEFLDIQENGIDNQLQCTSNLAERMGCK